MAAPSHRAPSRIGILPVGYHEGYDRQNVGHVLVRGLRAGAGACANMTMVDVTDVPGAAAGDVATCSAPTATAHSAGSSPHGWAPSYEPSRASTEASARLAAIRAALHRAAHLPHRKMCYQPSMRSRDRASAVGLTSRVVDERQGRSRRRRSPMPSTTSSDVSGRPQQDARRRGSRSFAMCRARCAAPATGAARPAQARGGPLCQRICGQFDERVYNSVTKAGEPMPACCSTRSAEDLGEPSTTITARRRQWCCKADPLLQSARRGTLRCRRVAHGLDRGRLRLGRLACRPSSAPASICFDVSASSRGTWAPTPSTAAGGPALQARAQEYCTLTLENGYDNIFFPVARARAASAIEKKLKLGLLGCGLPAYTHNLQAGKRSETLYIVPTSFSSCSRPRLIDDFLKNGARRATSPTTILPSQARLRFSHAADLARLQDLLHGRPPARSARQCGRRQAKPRCARPARRSARYL